MENAAEALKMAAFLLIFIVALTISILSFSEARRSAQLILEYNDREYDYSYVDDQNGQTQRIVSAENIVLSISRAYKENYKIFFYEKDGKPMEIYAKNVNGVFEPINYIDLQKENLADDAQRERFVGYILYGTKREEYENEFNNIVLRNSPLYDIIKKEKFEERLGEYYQEDLSEYQDGEDSESQDSVPTANKTKKRVISYFKQ